MSEFRLSTLISGYDIISCCIDQGGAYLLTSCKDGSLLLWDIGALKSKRPHRRFNDYRFDTIISFGFFKKFIFSAHKNGHIVFWRIETTEPELIIQYDGQIINCQIDPIPPCQFFAQLDDNSQAIYRIDNSKIFENFIKLDKLKKIPITFQNSDYENSSLNFSPSEPCVTLWHPEQHILAIGTTNGQLYLIDASESSIKKQNQKLRAYGLIDDPDQQSIVKKLSYSPIGHHGQLLAASFTDCTIRVFNVQWQTPLWQFDSPTRNAQFGSVGISSDGSIIAGAISARGGGCIILFDTTAEVNGFNGEDGQCAAIVLKPGSTAGVTDIKFHPHQRMFFSLSSSCTLYQWIEKKQERICSFAIDFLSIDQNELYIEDYTEFDDTQEKIYTHTFQRLSMDGIDIGGENPMMKQQQPIIINQQTEQHHSFIQSDSRPISRSVSLISDDEKELLFENKTLYVTPKKLIKNLPSNTNSSSSTPSAQYHQFISTQSPLHNQSYSSLSEPGSVVFLSIPKQNSKLMNNLDFIHSTSKHTTGYSRGRGRRRGSNKRDERMKDDLNVVDKERNEDKESAMEKIVDEPKLLNSYENENANISKVNISELEKEDNNQSLCEINSQQNMNERIKEQTNCEMIKDVEQEINENNNNEIKLEQTSVETRIPMDKEDIEMKVDENNHNLNDQQNNERQMIADKDIEIEDNEQLNLNQEVNDEIQDVIEDNNIMIKDIESDKQEEQDHVIINSDVIQDLILNNLDIQQYSYQQQQELSPPMSPDSSINSTPLNQRGKSKWMRGMSELKHLLSGGPGWGRGSFEFSSNSDKRQRHIHSTVGSPQIVVQDQQQSNSQSSLIKKEKKNTMKVSQIIKKVDVEQNENMSNQEVDEEKQNDEEIIVERKESENISEEDNDIIVSPSKKKKKKKKKGRKIPVEMVNIEENSNDNQSSSNNDSNISDQEKILKQKKGIKKQKVMNDNNQDKQEIEQQQQQQQIQNKEDIEEESEDEDHSDSKDGISKKQRSMILRSQFNDKKWDREDELRLGMRQKLRPSTIHYDYGKRKKIINRIDQMDLQQQRIKGSNQKYQRGNSVDSDYLYENVDIELQEWVDSALLGGTYNHIYTVPWPNEDNKLSQNEGELTDDANQDRKQTEKKKQEINQPEPFFFDVGAIFPSQEETVLQKEIKDLEDEYDCAKQIIKVLQDRIDECLAEKPERHRHTHIHSSTVQQPLIQPPIQQLPLSQSYFIQQPLYIRGSLFEQESSSSDQVPIIRFPFAANDVKSAEIVKKLYTTINNDQIQQSWKAYEDSVEETIRAQQPHSHQLDMQMLALCALHTATEYSTSYINPQHIYTLHAHDNGDTEMNKDLNGLNIVSEKNTENGGILEAEETAAIGMRMKSMMNAQPDLIDLPDAAQTVFQQVSPFFYMPPLPSHTSNTKQQNITQPHQGINTLENKNENLNINKVTQQFPLSSNQPSTPISKQSNIQPTYTQSISSTPNSDFFSPINQQSGISNYNQLISDNGINNQYMPTMPTSTPQTLDQPRNSLSLINDDYNDEYSFEEDGDSAFSDSNSSQLNGNQSFYNQYGSIDSANQFTSGNSLLNKKKKQKQRKKKKLKDSSDTGYEVGNERRYNTMIQQFNGISQTSLNSNINSQTKQLTTSAQNQQLNNVSTRQQQNQPTLQSQSQSQSEYYPNQLGSHNAIYSINQFYTGSQIPSNNNVQFSGIQTQLNSSNIQQGQTLNAANSIGTNGYQGSNNISMNIQSNNIGLNEKVSLNGIDSNNNNINFNQLSDGIEDQQEEINDEQHHGQFMNQLKSPQIDRNIGFKSLPSSTPNNQQSQIPVNQTNNQVQISIVQQPIIGQQNIIGPQKLILTSQQPSPFQVLAAVTPSPYTYSSGLNINILSNIGQQNGNSINNRSSTQIPVKYGRVTSQPNIAPNAMNANISTTSNQSSIISQRLGSDINIFNAQLPSLITQSSNGGFSPSPQVMIDPLNDKRFDEMDIMFERRQTSRKSGDTGISGAHPLHPVGQTNQQNNKTLNQKIGKKTSQKQSKSKIQLKQRNSQSIQPSSSSTARNTNSLNQQQVDSIDNGELPEQINMGGINGIGQSQTQSSIPSQSQININTVQQDAPVLQQTSFSSPFQYTSHTSTNTNTDEQIQNSNQSSV